MNNLTPDEFAVWAAAFAVVVGAVSYDRFGLPALAAARAKDAVEAYRELPAKPVVQRICDDHECDLCDQAQKLMESMNDKCVQAGRVIEEADRLCPSEPPPRSDFFRRLWESLRAYHAAEIALEAQERAEKAEG